MIRKGYMLMQIIIMIFLIGLMVITLVPILSSSISSYNRIKYNDELIYTCEMVVEKLRSQSESMTEVISQIENIGEIHYEDEDINNEKYKCKIMKVGSNDVLLEFIVRVESKDDTNTQYVEFKASVPKL